MALTPAMEEVLEQCAQRIVNGPGPAPRVQLLLPVFGRERHVMQATLRQYVERLSGGKLTVRSAAAELFAYRVRGLNLYLAVGDASLPEGRVEELTDRISLVSLGPYSNGFDATAEVAR